jgi:tetratricopeptide (TPR) repeat protein
MDSVMGTFLNQLRAAGLFDRSLIAVMADHGEALGEHGERGHGIFLYDPTIRVPLLFKMPGQRSVGKRIDARVELVDVLPTILKTVGVSVPKPVQGHSLITMTHAADAATQPEERPAYSETDYPRRAFGWSVLRSLRTGKYLFVQAPRPELYDETNDPAADHDLASTANAVAGTLSGQLTEFRRQTRSSGPALAAQLDPKQQAKLQALGYVASAREATESHFQDADPKDKIELSNLMTDVNFAMEEGQYERAIATLQGIIAKDPKLAPAYSALGAAWMHQGSVEKAVPALRKAAELNPDFATAHYELGAALDKAGDLQGAGKELEVAVAGSPASAEMRVLLASVYARSDRVEDAKKLLHQVLELRSNHYKANLLLGFISLMQHDPASALVYLQAAIDLNPDSSEAHRYMAEVYAQMGDAETAKRERALARQLQDANH